MPSPRRLLQPKAIAFRESLPLSVNTSLVYGSPRSQIKFIPVPETGRTGLPRRARERAYIVPTTRFSRGPAVLEVVVKCHLPFDGYLVGRHAALEEISDLLYILKLHEAKRIFGLEHGSNAERLKSAIGDVL